MLKGVANNQPEFLVEWQAGASRIKRALRETFGPGDLAIAMLADEATPEKVAALHREMGLDQLLVFQYLHWLGGALAGDLGRSVRTGEPVLTAILQRLPVTLELLLLAQLIALALGVPLGILCAVRAARAS